MYISMKCKSYILYKASNCAVLNTNTATKNFDEHCPISNLMKLQKFVLNNEKRVPRRMFGKITFNHPNVY